MKHRDDIPEDEDVLRGLSQDEARTVMEVSEQVCGSKSWRHRTNVRNRLYSLEAQGLAICDDERPQRWLLATR